MPLALAEPRVLSDATEVLSNPAAYADRPFLIHLARLVARSADNAAPTQRHLRAVQGGAA